MQELMRFHFERILGQGGQSDDPFHVAWRSRRSRQLRGAGLGQSAARQLPSGWASLKSKSYTAPGSILALKVRSVVFQNGEGVSDHCEVNRKGVPFN